MSPAAAHEQQIFRKDAKAKGKLLTKEEREKLIAVSFTLLQRRCDNPKNVGMRADDPQPYLPEPHKLSKAEAHAAAAAPGLKRERNIIGVRKFLKNQLHAFLFAVIHTIFSIYIRFRQAYHAVRDRMTGVLYYHHRTPELIQKDVKGLKRLPEHLSIILKLEEGGRRDAGIDTLMDEVAEVSAWCACAGIPMLSIYEKSGKSRLCAPPTFSTNRYQAPSSTVSQPHTAPSRASSAPTSAPITQLSLSAHHISHPWSLPQLHRSLKTLHHSASSLFFLSPKRMDKTLSST